MGKEMTPLFSVIISAYNVEQYLERCLDSFINQTFSDFEVLIIDDGSTDGTALISEKYVDLYHNVSCIHKQNGGLSSARNAGIAVAKGEYIHLCDADDWVSLDFLEKINNEIEKCKKHSIRKSVPDIIKFNYYRHTEGKINICKEKIEEGVYFSKNDIEMLLKKALNSTGDFWLSAWSHIYKREFLIKNGLEFVSERTVGSEDYLFNIEALLCASEIDIMNDAFYYYDLRVGSLTQKYRSRLAEQYINLYNEFFKFIEGKNVTEYIKDDFENMFLWVLIFGTCFTNEYHVFANHSIRDGRRNVKKICEMDGVYKVVSRQLKKTSDIKRIYFLAAMKHKIEIVFYWSFVKKRQIKKWKFGK